MPAFTAHQVRSVRYNAPPYLAAGGGSPDADTLFRSANSTALGSGDAALLDTNEPVPWTRHGGGTNVLAVVSATGKGMPPGVPNCLEVTHIAAPTPPTFYWRCLDSIWGVPGLGQTLYIRSYRRVEIDDSEGVLTYANTHPWESEGQTGSVNGNFWAKHYAGYGNGTYPELLAVDQASFPFNGWTPGGNSDPLHPGDPMPLNTFTTYRFEEAWTRTGSGLYTLDMRIYGADDSTLLFDKNSIKAWGGTSGQTLAANGTNLPVDDAHITDLRIGINGGFSPTVAQKVYWGPIRVRTAGWCGPYTALNG